MSNDTGIRMGNVAEYQKRIEELEAEVKRLEERLSEKSWDQEYYRDLQESVDRGWT